ncbi:tRNA lysidine(34) synthetase TilS [Arthrobacter castelli]|uniref:tRNA lysidine(34) synthetase TilS n=1 Tax=Arthrobacter castelli TaxID=271431 RepID=UPI0006863553|nr:tRNA lysidine(34) synthetase TilS [Arthrobacter castelli]
MGTAPGYRPRLAPVVGRGRQAVKTALGLGTDQGAQLGIPVVDQASSSERASVVDQGAQRGGAVVDQGAQRRAETPVLVACSGGPDSLALAVVTAFFARRGDIAAGAVVVDHGLQRGSASVAAETARVLTGMGLEPVEIMTVTVSDDGSGPEASARQARYQALEEAAARHDASSVLLGHTLDDQAESVLLGLARGSGTRSLSGMQFRRGRYLRPLLGLRRADTEAICAAEGLTPWHDPTNSDPAYLRSRVRAEVLPLLEEKLGPGIAESLYRSAQILGEDADFLEAEAARIYAELADVEPGHVSLPEEKLRSLAPALRHRVLALAAVEVGAEQPSRERIESVAALLRRRGSAGPVQLAGKVEVHRQVFGHDVPPAKRGYGSLVFTAKR